MTLASLPNALSSLLSDQVDGLMLMHLSSSLWDASPEQGVAALHLSQAPSVAWTSHKLCGGALGCTEQCIPRPTGHTGHHHEAELITTGHYHWLFVSHLPSTRLTHSIAQEPWEGGKITVPSLQLQLITEGGRNFPAARPEQN